MKKQHKHAEEVRSMNAVKPMPMKFRLFEVVRLIDGFPDDGIDPGTHAVVVDRAEPPAPGREAGYELQVYLPSRPTYTVSATEPQLAPLPVAGRRELWIMPVYGFHAFWATDGTTSGVHDNLSVEALGLGAALVADAAEWEAAYASACVDGYPGPAESGDGAVHEAHRAAGKLLSARVEAQLGSEWEVVYRYGSEYP